VKDLEKQKSYIGTNYLYRGLRSPEEKILFRKNFTFQKPYNLKLILKHYSVHWKQSKDFHLMNEALWAASKVLSSSANSQEEHLFMLKVFSSWLLQVDNWAHSDNLSSLLATLLDCALEANNKVLIDRHIQLRLEWKRSRNPWLRRQSIVSLLNYSRLRKNTLSFDQLINFVDPLCMDQAFYVQRAVGWTLREIYNLHPGKTYLYLTKNIHKIKSLAFTAATEKLSKQQKRKIIILRRKFGQST
jgi:3-methyladenine DNA glycosylase AlkD